MRNMRISKFSNPATGGRMVEVRVLDRHTTVIQPGGLCEETHRKHWQHVGTLMDEVKDHVKEQPTNRYKQRIIDAQRASAEAKWANA